MLPIWDVRAQGFEVASIRFTRGVPDVVGIRMTNGRLEAHGVSLKGCIMSAYGVGPRQIAGGPEWMGTDRFDISAKAENPASDEATRKMLQGLLADRFRLVVRHESRTLPALVLEAVAPKLEKAGVGAPDTAISGGASVRVLDAHGSDMRSLAEVLSRQMNLPVIDGTGLDGVFNFRLRWAPDASGAVDEPSIYTALREQLGLRLRSQKMAVDVLVIDSAARPAEN